jgi:VanZ family protein
MLKVILSPVAAKLAVIVFCLLLLLAVPLFFVGGPDWVASPLLKSAWDFGHIIFFTLLLVVVQWFIPLTHWRHWVGATFVAVLAGGAIEVAQHFVGRHASWGDVFNNLAGVWLGLFWGQHIGSAKDGKWIRWGRFLSLLLIGPALWLVVESAWAEWSLRRAFPQLNSFEAHYEWQQLRVNPARVNAQLTNEIASHGTHSLQLELAEGDYAGLRLRVCYGDWSKYERLAMDLFNPDVEPLAMMLRLSDVVHDRGSNSYNDRFNRALLLQPGWNKVQIAITDIMQGPQHRPMQLDGVCNLGLFAADLKQVRRFYIDNIRLE